MILGGIPLACVKCLANTATWNLVTRGESWTTCAECKTVKTAVLTDMRDLDPHMIRGWFGFDSGTGSTRCCGLVIVRGVLDGCGMQGGEPCMLDDGLLGYIHLIYV